jgi:ABC-type transport system involved in cytochrome c biogenesis permease component
LRTFCRRFAAFVAGNPNLSVFLVGFAVFSGALAQYSAVVAGVSAGGILMAVAAYPVIAARKG